MVTIELRILLAMGPAMVLAADLTIMLTILLTTVLTRVYNGAYKIAYNKAHNSGLALKVAAWSKGTASAAAAVTTVNLRDILSHLCSQNTGD